MMKLLIFGATGKTGLHLVQQALALGHQVTVFVRNPACFPVRHANLKTIPGDILDPRSVKHAIHGHDAVLSSIDPPAHKIGTVCSLGTQNIVIAMQKAGVKRFIAQAALGYGDSRKTLDRTPFFFRYIIVPFILRKGFADHALQEEYIKQSGLDWVIARPGNLTDGPLTGAYRHGFSASDKKIKVKISRADTADFMLKQLTSDLYLWKTPGLSY